MPVEIWSYEPGDERTRYEQLKAHLEELEKKGTIGQVIPMHEVILVQWTPGPKRESRREP